MSGLGLLGWVIQLTGIAFICYSLLINTSFLGLTALALFDVGSHRRRLDFAAYDESFGEPLARSVSVLMPAYNEQATIVSSVQAMLAMRYPDFEVVVIDDGSRDGTVATLVEAFDMVEVPLVVGRGIPTQGSVHRTYVSRRGSQNLLLVCKSNGGKADALNVGINASRNDLVCMVDADSLLDPDALLHVARPFADDPQRVVASGGVVRVANGSTIRAGRVVRPRMPRGWLPRIQVVEYLRAFLIGRSGWSAAGGLMIISGAFGIFRRDVLLQVGGLATDCIGEDAELVVRIHRWLGDNRIDGRVVFVGEPVAWTEAPEDPQVLRKQRRRWHRGLTEIMGRHKGMLLRPRYGVIGMVTMPWFLLFELLAPFVELFGFAFFAIIAAIFGLEEVGVLPGHLVDPWLVAALFAASVLYATLMTLATLVAEEISYRKYSGVRDLLTSVRAAVEENFGYRQLNAWWRVSGSIEAVRRVRPEWGDMKRKGFSAL